MSFLASLPPPGPSRNRVILSAIVAGGLDPVTWHPVPFKGCTLLVTARYLTIGGETVPMCGDVAQAAADYLDGALPTVEVVDAIEAAPGAVRAYLPTQQPTTYGAEQSTAAIVRCELATVAMLARLNVTEGALVVGYRKDVVTPAPPGMVAIYGARWPMGGRLQGYSDAHGLHYSDYAEGTRVVRGMAEPWRYPLPW